MKTLRRIALFSCILNVVVAGVSDGAQREAYLKSMIGSVKVRKGESPIWKDGHQQMVLREKDAVRTFVESQAEVMTVEGSVMKLDENSTLEMSTMKEFGGGAQSTKIKIIDGTILANIKKLVNTGSSFEFETPTAVASIRGTVLGISVTGDQTSIKVYDGEVMVKPRGGTASVSVKSNQMVTVVKGQKTVTAETITEKDKNMIVPQDTAHKDTTKQAAPPDTSAKKPGTAIDTTHQGPAKPGDTTGLGSSKVKPDATAQLFLHVTSPSDGQKFGVTVIPVTGVTTPGADVSVSGIKCQVSPNGTFSGRIPIADEENEVILEFDAVLGSQTQQVVRRILYQPDVTMLITSPQAGQILNTTSIQVAGQILPSTAELIVYDTKIPISTNGKFMGYVTIPDEEGQVTLNFDVSYQGTTRSDTRTITYKRAVDKIAPVIQPTSIPAIYKTGSMSFTVFDQTPDDEVTFYKITDGSRESETGKPNSSFNLALEEGIHNYTVYAEDIAKNRSAQVTGTVTYLSRSFTIKMRKPLGTETIKLPPSSPAGAFTPVYSVQFTILNVPDDDRRLIKQVSVTNLATNKTVTQKNILDLDMEFDVELQRGNNPLSVDILDVLDRPFSEKDIMVIVR